MMNGPQNLFIRQKGQCRGQDGLNQFGPKSSIPSRLYTMTLIQVPQTIHRVLVSYCSCGSSTTGTRSRVVVIGGFWFLFLLQSQDSLRYLQGIGYERGNGFGQGPHPKGRCGRQGIRGRRLLGGGQPPRAQAFVANPLQDGIGHEPQGRPGALPQVVPGPGLNHEPQLAGQCILVVVRRRRRRRRRRMPRHEFQIGHPQGIGQQHIENARHNGCHQGIELGMIKFVVVVGSRLL